MLSGRHLLAGLDHLSYLGVVLVGIIAIDVAITGARSGVDGAFALLKATRRGLCCVCMHIIVSQISFMKKEEAKVSSGGYVASCCRRSLTPFVAHSAIALAVDGRLVHNDWCRLGRLRLLL